MPELPEVETFVRQLRDQLVGNIITNFTLVEQGERIILPYTTSEILHFVIDRTIVNILRHGKYIIIELDREKYIIAHLRMTGRFEVTREPIPNNHNRLYFQLANGQYLNFIDIRKFATLKIEKSPNHMRLEKISKLGPDAISSNFNVDYLYAKTQKTSRNIYSLLMDQNIVAGIGNIYANESLFRAGIHPQSPSKQIGSKKIAQLIIEIKEILNFAISFKGTTLIDNTYKDLTGQKG